MQTLHLFEGQKNNLLNYFSNLKRFKATLNVIKIDSDISGISLFDMDFLSSNLIYHKCRIKVILENEKISNDAVF